LARKELRKQDRSRHTLDRTQIQPKMDKLRRAYLAGSRRLKGLRKKEKKNLTDVRSPPVPFEICGAYIVGGQTVDCASRQGKRQLYLDEFRVASARMGLTRGRER